ncbi:MAG: non-heme iron oxygenase ferredoxin subunit [SAR202 cluster bacterium]|nr:non-heme iron oxygenase ferredoxin subunit [SAR202 cluster bacterium]
MPTTFTKVAKTGDLQDGQKKLVRVGFEQIVIARVDGEFYAFEEFCAHAGGSLSGGTLQGHEIVCPLHGARYDIRSGKQRIGPASSDQLTYQVRVEGDDVLVGPANEVAGGGMAVAHE